MSQQIAPTLFPLNALPEYTGTAAQDVLLFNALQDRHVPVTPKLIRALAQMQTAIEPASIAPWGVAYEHAGAAIGLSGRFGRSPIWAAMTDQFVSQLAEPVLRRAAMNLGRGFLTQFDPAIATSLALQRAKSACKTLEEEVDRLLADPAAMPKGFWSYAGLALLSASRRRTAAGRRNRPHSVRVDSMLAQLVYDIEPVLPAGPAWQRRQQKATLKSANQKSGLRPREGGVTGVIHSRRIEDVDAALSSTFAYPQELLVSRLMEEGFLITHRPPRRKPNRDMLFLILNDASPEDGPASVAKAAWIDATLRLSLLLKKAQMLRTEFGWCDLTQGGVISSALSLETLDRDAQMSISGVAAAAALAGPLRRSMISKSSLVPGAFAATPSQSLADLPSDQRLRRATQGLVAEALANAPAGESPTHRADSTARSPGRELADYAVVYLLRISSAAIGDAAGAAMREVDWPRDRSRILRETALKTRGRLVLGEILLPRMIAPGEHLSLATDMSPQAQTISIPQDAETPDDGLATLIGSLSDWMITEILQALHAG